MLEKQSLFILKKWSVLIEKKDENHYKMFEYRKKILDHCKGVEIKSNYQLQSITTELIEKKQKTTIVQIFSTFHSNERERPMYTAV